VVPIPSPGKVERGWRIVPASHMNFYIANAVVVVPHLWHRQRRRRGAAIGAVPRPRGAIGLRADHILTGGGSFHCISQQQPEIAPSLRIIRGRYRRGMTRTITVAGLQLAFSGQRDADIADRRRRARGGRQGRAGGAAARTVRRPLFLPARG
jgi:hypothetical protein